MEISLRSVSNDTNEHFDLEEVYFCIIELSYEFNFAHQTPNQISLAIELTKSDIFGPRLVSKVVLPIYVYFSKKIKYG